MTQDKSRLIVVLAAQAQQALVQVQPQMEFAAGRMKHRLHTRNVKVLDRRTEPFPQIPGSENSASLASSFANGSPVAAATALPAETVAPSNPHRRQPPTRRPAGSFLGGFRTPAFTVRANSYDGPASETLH
jgi:hypothetical protein